LLGSAGEHNFTESETQAGYARYKEARHRVVVDLKKKKGGTQHLGKEILAMKSSGYGENSTSDPGRKKELGEAGERWLERGRKPNS
jgi:hypothetical protein